MFLTFIAVPCIFIGGWLMALGVMGSIGGSYIAAGHASSDMREPTDPRSRSRRQRFLKWGAKLVGIGVVLALVGSL